MDTEKVFLGMPAYGWNWQIYDKPANIGKTYRGTSQTYYAAIGEHLRGCCMSGIAIAFLKVDVHTVTPRIFLHDADDLREEGVRTAFIFDAGNGRWR